MKLSLGLMSVLLSTALTLSIKRQNHVTSCENGDASDEMREAEGRQPVQHILWRHELFISLTGLFDDEFALEHIQQLLIRRCGSKCCFVCPV